MAHRVQLLSRALTVRMSPAERDSLGRRAAVAGLSLSRYFVECGLSPDRLPSPGDRARFDRALFHLRAIGVNLNQTARALHRRETVEPAALDDALRAVADAAARLRGWA
jgi:hypothetical protein